MKILIISTLINPTPPIKYGGIERFVHDLATELNKTNEVLVVRTSGTKKVKYNAINTTQENLINTVKEVVNNFSPDIIQVNQKIPELFEYLKNIETKKVITIHNNFRKSSSYNEVIKEFNKSFYITVISKSLKNRVNKSLRSHSIKVDNKIENLGYGLNLEKITANKTTVSPYYIYLGNIARYKGVLDIANAFSKLKKDLLIVGPVSSKDEVPYFKEVMKVVNENINIKYFGVPKNDKEKFKLIKNANALVIATGYDKKEKDCHEAFGLVMLEANALAVPVIGYKKGNISDYILNGKNGYKFNNIGEIKEITKNLEKNIKNFKCKSIAKKYDIKIVAENYLNYFYKIYEN